MKARWSKVGILAAVFCLLLVSGPGSEASPRVIVDQYDYQEDFITIAYPHFDGMDNREAQDKMNALVEEQVYKFIAEAHKGGDCLKEYNANRAHEFQPVAQLKYKVWYNDENLLSITMSGYEFFGGAHGMSYMTGYTFNLETGKVIPYDGMFKWDTKSRELAHNSIMKQVEERKIFLFKEGNQTNLAKMINDPGYVPNYYLVEKDKPVVVFQQYEIAPYAAGILQFQL